MSTAEKPQVVNTSEKLTDTVVNSTQQTLTKSAPTNTTRSINAYGIQNLRGGNALGTGLIDSILNAYANLFSYNPIPILLLFIASLYYLSVIIGTANADPFSRMVFGIANKTATLEPGPLKSLSTAFTGVFALLDTYKTFFALVFLFSAVYLAKPSTRNAVTSALLVFSCLLFSFNALMVLAMGHGYFLYTQLRDPKHKSIVLLTVVVCVFIGSTLMGEMVGIDTISAKYGVTTTVDATSRKDASYSIPNVMDAPQSTNNIERSKREFVQEQPVRYPVRTPHQQPSIIPPQKSTVLPSPSAIVNPYVGN